MHEDWGVFRPFDLWAPFVPAFVMFVIKNRVFSYCFLFLYIALSVLMFFQVRSIHLSTYGHAAWDIPLGHLGLFFFVSIGCLVIYAVGALVRFAIKIWNADRSI
jgi:hypothetical protein